MKTVLISYNGSYTTASSIEIALANCGCKNMERLDPIPFCQPALQKGSYSLIIHCHHDPNQTLKSLDALAGSDPLTGVPVWVADSMHETPFLTSCYQKGVQEIVHLPVIESEIRIKLQRLFSKQSDETMKPIAVTAPPIPPDEDLMTGQVTLQDYTNDAIVVYPLDPEGRARFLFANKVAQQLYGYSLDEFKNLTLRDVSLELDENNEKMTRLLEDIHQTGESVVTSLHHDRHNRQFEVEIKCRYIEIECRRLIVATIQDISKKLEIQRRLALKESQLYEALRLGKMAYWGYDLESGMIQLNDQYFDLLGTTAHLNGGYEVSFRQWLKKFVHPDDAGILLDAIKGLRQKPTSDFSGSVYFRYLHGSGDYGYMHARYYLHHNDTAQVRVFGICQDVTCEKANELEYLKNRRQLEITQQGIDTANIGVYQVNYEGKIEYVNHCACEMTGFSKSELLSMHITELDAVLDKESWQRFRDASFTQQYILFQTKHRCKQGELIDVEISAHSQRLERHQFSYCFVRNISELEHQKQRLIESEKKFKLVVARAPSLGVMAFDSETRIVFWNKTNEKIYGYTEKEALGKSIVDLVIPVASRQQARKDIQQAFRNSMVPEASEVILQRKDGSPVSVFSSRTLIQEEDQPKYYWVDVELTEMKQARTEKDAAYLEMAFAKDSAEKANRSKDAFIAMMSHEMRTPLNPIIGFSEILRQECRGEHKEYLDIIYRSGRRLQTLITDVLDFTRLGEGKLQAKPSDFNLLELCKSVFSDTLPVKTGVTLRFENTHRGCDPIPENLEVRSDPQMIFRILENLLIRACQFTSKGEILLKVGLENSTDPKAPFFHASIKDTGTAMDEKTLKRLFEPFSHAETGFTCNTEGIGLGLSISKRLVELLDGRIEVANRQHPGTTFHIRVPIFESGIEVAANPPHSDSFKWQKIPGEPTVLIVDDNENNVRIISVMLEKMGCRFSVAHNGEDAVDFCSRTRFDLILMDLRMPVLDGLSATRLLRIGDGPNQNTPVVGLSAQVTQSVISQADDAGMNGYLEKPFSPATLQDTVRSYLSPNTGSGSGS